MEEQNKKYEKLTEVEKAIIYSFLDRLKNDVTFREKMRENPELVLSTAMPSRTYQQLLSPNVLEVLGNMRRVALEEIGIDVFQYRDVVGDNGFKISPL